MRIRSFSFSVSAALGIALSSSLTAAPPVFTVDLQRIVDSSTPLPNDPSKEFDATEPSSVVNGGSGLLFANASLGGANPSTPGLYRSSINGLDNLVASGAVPFKSGGLFDQNYANNGSTVFRARTVGSSGIDESLWFENGGVISNVVPVGAQLPDGVGSASVLWYPRISGDDVIFVGAGADDQRRIYKTTTSGEVVTTLIANELHPQFDNAGFDLGDFEGDQFVFRDLDQGFGGGRGVYTSDLDGNVTEIAGIGDPVPGQEDVFSRFGGGTTHPSLDEGRVAFIGQGANNSQGVYVSSITGDTLEVVVDQTFDLPNDNGITIGFGTPSISGDNVAFTGIAPSGRGSGVFVSIAGTIVDVIHAGDTLDGKVISSVVSGSFALHENTVAFTVRFEDNTRGLYSATVIPTPGAGVIIAIGGAWVARRTRRFA